MKMYETKETRGEVINIGSNYEISIGDTAKMIAEIINVPLEIETEDIRLRPDKSEVERLWADNTKANVLLDWNPLYGGKDGFKKGLTETIEWFSNPANLKMYKSNGYTI